MENPTNLPELPQEIVAEIASFIPRAIDKYSRVECRAPIISLRHKRAKNLHSILMEYYIFDWDDLETQKKHGYKPVDPEDVLWSAEPDHMSETLSMISAVILQAAGWDLAISNIEWEWNSPFQVGPWETPGGPFIFNEPWYKRLRWNNSYSFDVLAEHSSRRILPYI